MKKRNASLTTNVNILIVIITLAISLSMVVITNANYRRFILDPYEENMNSVTVDADELSEYFSYFMQYLDTDEFRAVRETTGTEDDQLIDWMITKPSLDNDDPTLSRSNLFLDWISLDVLFNNLNEQFNLDEVCAEVQKGQTVYRISHCERKTGYTSNQDFGLEEPFVSDSAEKYDRAVTLKTDGSYLLLRCIRISFEDGEGRVWLARDMTEAQREHRMLLLYSVVYIVILTFAASVLSAFLLRRYVTRPIRLLAESATRFEANEDGTYSPEKVSHVEVRSGTELGDLSREITSMQTRIVENTANLSRLSAEKERIVTELSMAAKIQSSMLPCTFPPFPGRGEFDLFASMTPARNVGGDFYDFFLIDDDHLALVMADVSGKGIPGALFMMVSKFILENNAIMSSSPAEILHAMNETVCSNNKMDMFVTVWLGILEISTGIITAANAGHEYPVIYKQGAGKFDLFKDRHGFVIGGMEGLSWKDYEFSLEPGDKLFLYTDGIPEATDESGTLFGKERMLDALNACRDGSPEEILTAVKVAVDTFAGDAEQFDDMTMLLLEYNG